MDRGSASQDAGGPLILQCLAHRTPPDILKVRNRRVADLGFVGIRGVGMGKGSEVCRASHTRSVCPALTLSPSPTLSTTYMFVNAKDRDRDTERERERE